MTTQTTSDAVDTEFDAACREYYRLLLTHQQQCTELWQQPELKQTNLTNLMEQMREWISLSEQAYTELLGDENYLKAYGQLINAWLRKLSKRV